jgi:serine/threonine protein kinase
MKQVSKGLEELHAIGFAHCDVCIANVFIDFNGIVFLDDLEYLTPINDPPPHETSLWYQ